MEANLRGVQILVEAGDLTRARVDAVVNAANNHLWMGGGVAGALKRAGGEAIEQEAVSRGPIPIGGAVVTGAGRLPARRVIHAATMGQDLRTSCEIVRRATASALRRAAEEGLRTVAFPALGTGVGGLSFEECAEAMLEAVAAAAEEGTAPETVHFVVVGDQAAEAFKRILARSETRKEE